VNRRLKQFERRVQSRHPDVLIEILNRDFVQPCGAGLARAAETDFVTGQGLQLECGVFEDVAHPRAAAKPFEETSAHAFAAPMFDHRRQPAHQPVVEALDHLG